MFRIVMLACLLVATASCRPQFQPQTVQVADPGPPERVLPTIRVLDPGLTPRQPLRYRVPPGQVETLYVELAEMEVMEAEGRGAKSGMPPVQLEVKLGPASMTPQGYIRHPVAITQVRISEVADKMSPAQREELEKSLAPLLNVQGWSEMDLQGRIRRGQFEGLDSVSPQLSVMLGNVRSALLSVPFPDQPLGVRARWEVERRVQLSSFWVDQVVTYEIQRIRDDAVGMQVSARQTARPQQLGNGRLEVYQASVIGSADVRLTNFTAFSEAESITQMHVSQPTASGENQLIRIERRTAVQLYPAGGKKEPAEPEEKPADPDDVKVITDPGKQKLKWHTPEK